MECVWAQSKEGGERKLRCGKKSVVVRLHRVLRTAVETSGSHWRSIEVMICTRKDIFYVMII